MSTTPPWVRDEALVQHLLHTMLDKVERGVKPYIRIEEKTAPQLYRFNEEDTEFLWGLITLLDNEYHLITIKRNPKRFPEAHYHLSQLYLNEEKVPLLRAWLDRPALDAYSTVWKIIVAEYAKKVFVQHQLDLSPLSNHPIRYGSKSAELIIAGFCRIPEVLNSPKSLRTLSAQCFWGDSKFLDNRGLLLAELFPPLMHFIQARPLLINAYIPQDFAQVLFIENQDTFLEMIQVSEEYHLAMALVYSAGFRGTAQRAREQNGVAWSYLNSLAEDTRTRFELWWSDADSDEPTPLESNPTELPVYFWGDFDYAAMAILAALRKTFPQLQAWQPGYKAMLTYHKQGVSHRLDEAQKENQRAPIETGCPFADGQLLPLLRSSELFVDQEIVDIQSIFRSELD